MSIQRTWSILTGLGGTFCDYPLPVDQSWIATVFVQRFSLSDLGTIAQTKKGCIKFAEPPIPPSTHQFDDSFQLSEFRTAAVEGLTSTPPPAAPLSRPGLGWGPYPRLNLGLFVGLLREAG